MRRKLLLSYIIPPADALPPSGYWQGLASSTHFSGSSLKTCLRAIHTEITSSWNFNDPNNVRFTFITCSHGIHSISAIKRRRLSEKHSDPCSTRHSRCFGSTFMVVSIVHRRCIGLRVDGLFSSQRLGDLQNIIGVGSTLASAIAPAVAAIGLSVMFIQWVTTVYKQTCV